MEAKNTISKNQISNGLTVLIIKIYDLIFICILSFVFCYFLNKTIAPLKI